MSLALFVAPLLWGYRELLVKCVKPYCLAEILNMSVTYCGSGILVFHNAFHVCDDINGYRPGDFYKAQPNMVHQDMKRDIFTI